MCSVLALFCVLRIQLSTKRAKICFSIGFKLLFRERMKDKNNNHNDQINYMLDNKCNNKCRAQGDVGLGLEVSAWGKPL